MKVLLFGLSLIGIIGGLVLLNPFQSQAELKQDDDIATVVVTFYPELPSSFDPLSAQRFENFFTMCALYARPLEFDDLGRYRSTLLEKFSYLDQTHTLQFCLKRNQFFSDGSPITLDDLAFNIARVAKSFSKIGHLKEVEGIDDWLKQPYPLLNYPKGFKLDRDFNCLNIHYNSAQPSPFYNFTCPMHGIIPKASVDLESGELKISTPPFSGPYTLTQLNPDSYTLERRNTIAPSNFPEKILVKMVLPSKIGPILREAHKSLVLIAENGAFGPSDQELLDKKFRSPPQIENYISGFIFNTSPNHLFSDLRLRQFFAEEFRQSVAELGATPNGSLFTLIQPGYVPLQELRAHREAFTHTEREMFLRRLREHSPVAGSFYSSFFQRAFELTAQRLGLKQNYLSYPRDEIMRQFYNGNLDIVPIQMFYGSLEPVEGPRLLISLEAVSYYKFLNKNSAISEALSKSYQIDPFNVDLEGVKNLSRIIFEDASLSIYRNFSVDAYVLKDSPLKFRTMFLRMDLMQFFSEVPE